MIYKTFVASLLLSQLFLFNTHAMQPTSLWQAWLAEHNEPLRPITYWDFSEAAIIHCYQVFPQIPNTPPMQSQLQFLDAIRHELSARLAIDVRSHATKAEKPFDRSELCVDQLLEEVPWHSISKTPEKLARQEKITLLFFIIDMLWAENELYKIFTTDNPHILQLPERTQAITFNYEAIKYGASWGFGTITKRFTPPSAMHDYSLHPVAYLPTENKSVQTSHNSLRERHKLTNMPPLQQLPDSNSRN